MNLRKKKALAVRTLKVGKSRIVFLQSRLEDINKALTKQDIRDLVADKAIIIKEIKGRKKVVKLNRKSPGNIRKKVNIRKRDYIIMTRKLRAYVAELKKQGKLSSEEVKDIRKKIKNKVFKSKAYLKNYVEEIKE